VRALVRLLVAALAVVVVACGVPEDDGPQELSADQVPFGLLTTPTTTTQPNEFPEPGRRATLYFVNADAEIVDVVREVPDQSPRSVITTLLETDSNSLDPGVSSNIPPGTRLLDILRDDELLTVDLSEEFNSVTGERFIRAVAQIVFTATDLSGIDLVAFRVDGEPIEVGDGTGAAQSDPVSANDYQNLLAVS
jgi:spore germination protein GerM